MKNPLRLHYPGYNKPIMNYGKRKKKPPIYDAETGVPPTPKQIEKMTSQAWNVSLYALGQQNRTSYEIVEKLKKKGITEDIINSTLKTLEEANYLDDRDYTFSFVERKQRTLGASQISWKLKDKGVDPDLIAEAIAGIDEEESYEGAMNIARSKVRLTRRVEDKYKRTQNIASAVIRRGFSSSLAFQVTQAALEESEAEEV